MFERLTIRTDICVEPENNIVYNNPNDPDGMYNILDLAECLYNGGEIESSILLKISNRLAAYEDSGLSPDEVLELKEKYETEKTNSEAAYTIMCGLTEEVERLKKCLAEYEQAKADGRLVVLPCKVGDAVWKIKSAFSYFTKPMEDRVERIIIYKNEILVCCTSGAKFSIGSVGKAVFLSREEAEKALEVGKP
jgi:hypothetical protein